LHETSHARDRRSGVIRRLGGRNRTSAQQGSSGYGVAKPVAERVSVGYAIRALKPDARSLLRNLRAMKQVLMRVAMTALFIIGWGLVWQSAIHP
jgi:hypothetical protein